MENQNQDQDIASSQKIISFNQQQQNSQFFFTRVIQNIVKVNLLNSYIDQLQEKVEKAKWKQSLLLQYNYMPLNSIKQKIQTQKTNYQNKILQFHKNSQRQFQNSDLLQQLQNFRIFSQKLEDTLSQIKKNIQNSKISNKVLKASCIQKRNRLKNLLKDNMQLNKAFAQKMGAQNKQDLIKIIRSKSERVYKPINSSITKINKLTQKPLQNEQNKKNNPFLFSQCYKLLEQQIKHMRSNQDIQSGIYLQIIQKDHNPFANRGRYSLKSNISNTLHERYGKKSTYNKKKADFKQFQMDWQSFKQLNWKQIIGILAIKGVGYEKIKELVQFQ